LFFFCPACRKILKPQPDLLYEDRNGTGVFKNCIVGRYATNWGKEVLL
jgi:hypothetical protein